MTNSITFHILVGILYSIAATLIYGIGFVRGFKRGAKAVDEMINNQLDALIAEMENATEKTKQEQNA